MASSLKTSLIFDTHLVSIFFFFLAKIEFFEGGLWGYWQHELNMLIGRTNCFWNVFCFLFGFGILFIHGIHQFLWSRTHKMVFCLKIVRVIYVCYCLQWMSYASVSSSCCCTQ